MIRSFDTFLNKAGQFTAAESKLLKDELQTRVLKKGELLLDKGAVCNSLSFIIKGAIYQYKVDMDLNKTIINLNVASDWVIDYKSFSKRLPSEHYIKCFEDTTIYVLSISSIHQLIAQSQSFLQMGRILDESTDRIHFFDNNLSPDEKYQYILNTQPALLQKFPQKLIASYLKITPETLSRVRRRVANL